MDLLWSLYGVVMKAWYGVGIDLVWSLYGVCMDLAWTLYGVCID